ncbi:MAG: hypothetical protein P4L50_12780 [Anaerolineaceae bacterium]|nr:hypothetical protein [Anaerolineaceae bacterium]
MNKKWIITILMVACVMALSLVGGKWSRASADSIPTIPTIPTKAPHGGGGGGGSTTTVVTPPPPVMGPVGPTINSDIFYPGWGGVTYGIGSACNVGAVSIFRLDATKVPNRQQLFFHREILEVRYYEGGAWVLKPPCGPITVYFDLYYFEKFFYGLSPDKVGIFMYDVASQKWNKCTDMKMIDNGAFGRISCTANQSGFFAVGYAAPQP